MTKRSLTLIVYIIMCCSLAFAQHTRQWVERTGGVYYAYPVTVAERVVAPDGYEPFYISHYGRHGSRWLPSEERYEWVMAQFADKSRLTSLGLSVSKRLKKICRNASGNAGQLTALGHRQHRDIARRMADGYPSVFLGEGATVEARSSTVPRCRASMLAFCGELQRRYKGLSLTSETDPSFMPYINYESPELKELSRRTISHIDASPDRFIGSLFTDASHIDQPLKLMSELHTIASDMQDIPLGISLWDIFKEDEMLAVHDANNVRMTICNGDTMINSGIPARSSIPLWLDIESKADAAIAGHAHGATLRFGHDTALYRLLTLLGVQLTGKGMEDIIPMAANLQMVFFRKGYAEDSVVVGFLHNERIVTVAGLSPVAPGLFRWTDVKAMMKNRIHSLEHLRQLSSLNTMVGTAPANTSTAGLFGKGSEEHGQTLPAVLVPNGQTFWTPQTRETERKCVAPYYYTDTIFQGIRASHWIVGGCTQDYGSFTLSAVGANTFVGANASERLNSEPIPTLRGVGSYSHADEVSHPYYYSLRLPSERLRIELTALSHSAIIRITPEIEQPVTITLKANSDEQQATVSIDEVRRLVTASNPVHRIYQGWGESAGFSGHIALEYPKGLVESRTFADGVQLLFNTHANEPIELRMATSFTSTDGALANLRAEATTFDDMERRCIGLWEARFHTLDVEDSDTARVNQFYGALYRASFLPREMSDADGTYPKFALSKGKSDYSSLLGREGGGEVHYGDFSMWDTYRALHPLLCIIAPQETAEMMQSLVDMYKDGGWLPIFPCWNSYTAAMIGDHCTVTLADAYAKGIRGFDAQTAYEAMRKNAFELPSTEEEYKNGMGRRALASYLKYGYIPLEDSVKEAFHTQEQTSRTLEYAFDDFAVAQMARLLGHDDDYQTLMRRSENWRNVINPKTGWADGRYADGRWEGCTDIVHRQPFITEGATCHYTWYVPHNVDGLVSLLGGRKRTVQRLDSMFTEHRYWHGNEPCHQIPWLYSAIGDRMATARHTAEILNTEYNDTPGGLSGNDDAGQMSAWQLFAYMGFYPLCPATPRYQLSSPLFHRITINPSGGQPFVLQHGTNILPLLNGHPINRTYITHDEILKGGTLQF